MLNRFWFHRVLSLSLLFALGGCNLFSFVSGSPPDVVIEETSAWLITLTAQALMPESTNEAATLTPTRTSLATQTEERTRTPQVTPSPSAPCDFAAAGSPLDVTIPDDSRLLPGQTFSKTWRLVNRGSCTWTRDYALVWFSGPAFDAVRQQPLSTPVAPGEVVDLTIDMTAPRDPGVYTGYWMLRNADGDLFGIGPGGNSPFWVRIQVVAVATITSTPTITPTATPVVQSSGTLTLLLDEAVELDSGQLNPAEGGDLAFEQAEGGQLVFTPLNNSRLGLFSNSVPGFNDCRRVSLDTRPIPLEEVDENSYLCYRTSQGLPGMLAVIELAQDGSAVTFDYITWAIP